MVNGYLVLFYFGHYGLSQLFEGSFYLMVVLGTNFDEADAKLCGQIFAFLSLNRSLVPQVALIANEQDLHVRVAVVAGLLQPVAHMLERMPAGDVVHQQCAYRSPIVGPGDGPEILLPRRVPDLQLHILVPHEDLLGPELHPDGHIMVFTRFVLNELEDDAGFAHPRVPDQDELEQVMISIHAFNN